MGVAEFDPTCEHAGDQMCDFYTSVATIQKYLIPLLGWKASRLREPVCRIHF